MKSLIFVFFVIFSLARANNIYQGKNYDVKQITKRDFLVLEVLLKNIHGLELWENSCDPECRTRMFVPEEFLEIFESFLKSEKVQFEALTEVPESVFNIKKKEGETIKRGKDDATISFTKFHSHSEINAYLDNLAERFPTRVTVEVGGTTFLSREIKVVKISSSGGTNTSKPIIVVDAGMHGSEWISPPVALYMITKLVENITENDVANDIDWIIIPLLNADGYEFTFTGARLWTKNRSKTVIGNCQGVEINRNFDFKWLETGATSNPCSEIYGGPQPFSEIESRILRDIIIENKKRVKAYVSFHSYGSYVLYPYSYDGSNSSNVNELYSLGSDIAFAMSVFAPGVKYKVGNLKTMFNKTISGTSADWVKSVGEVDLTYNIVLPEGGSAGVNIPASRIDSIVRETWSGMVVLAKYVIKKATKEGMYKTMNKNYVIS